MEKIRAEIRDALTGIAEELRSEGSNRPWTLKIKEKLAEIGKLQGYEICCSGFERGSSQSGWGEWMFDMCWLEKSEKDGMYRSMPFALESEWGSPAGTFVLSDFQKLVFSNASLKLSVWQNKNRGCLQDDMNLFTEQLELAGCSPTLFMFAGFSWTKKTFEFFVP